MIGFLLSFVWQRTGVFSTLLLYVKQRVALLTGRICVTLRVVNDDESSDIAAILSSDMLDFKNRLIGFDEKAK